MTYHLIMFLSLGTVTDGEFSTLQTQGDTRPVHLWQLIHDARESVAKMSKTGLKQMLQIDDDNTCVPEEVRWKLHHLLEEGLTFEDGLHHIRNDLIPDGYTYHPWRINVMETELDMLRSITATYKFRERVRELREEGADFTRYIYVPEVDQTTQREHHEREDHNHIMKRLLTLEDSKKQWTATPQISHIQHSLEYVSNQSLMQRNSCPTRWHNSLVAKATVRRKSM
ncbi:uncharacterized protein LOC144880633 [Branchiostoma floridae x Branchiostoma japonicum]